MAEREEIDTFDSWEELEDSGVDGSALAVLLLKERLVFQELDKQIEKIQLNQMSIQNSMSNVKPGPLILSPEDIRLKCMPPEPSVKILQRPNHNGLRNGLVNGETKPKQPVKTLQQREQEYAEARLRILGEARSPEEEQYSSQLDERIQKIQTKTEILRPLENCAGIIRLPKGPDGTSGFNFRR